MFRKNLDQNDLDRNGCVSVYIHSSLLEIRLIIIKMIVTFQQFLMIIHIQTLNIHFSTIAG